MIKDNDIIKELVQVKNMSAKLTLSDLSPKKQDSFFKRCLHHKSSHNTLVLKILSFGEVSEEIEIFSKCIDKKNILESNVGNKLIKYGYTEDDIIWLSHNLSVEKVLENEIVAKIYDYLMNNIYSMPTPEIVFDVLIQHVSESSLKKQFMSKSSWDEKLETIKIDLSMVNTWQKQFGTTLKPIHMFKDSNTLEAAKKQYNLGANAKPEHIRNGFDIIRDNWLNKIEESFTNDDIVIIKGNSGQGKTSLALRYMLDRYAENNIIVLERLNTQQIINEVSDAVIKISEYKDKLIIYMDVAPNNIQWIHLCESISEKNAKVKLLVTIRNEEFNKTNINRNKAKFAEIELKLDEDEGRLIYSKIENSNFITFRQAWKVFGGQGSFLEFLYLLNNNVTLKDTLKAQIDSIMNNPESDTWIKIIYVISLVSKYGLKLSKERLFNSYKSTEKFKLTRFLNNEYFIEDSENDELVFLHIIRATIICSIIEDYKCFSKEELLSKATGILTCNYSLLLIDFIYCNGMSTNLVENLAQQTFLNWGMYGGILKALLWADARPDYVINAAGNREELTCCVDLFISLSKDKLPTLNLTDEKELEACGYCLSWLAKKGAFLIEQTYCLNFKISNKYVNRYINFALGLKLQNMKNSFNLFMLSIKNILIERYKIVSYKNINGTIHIVFYTIEEYCLNPAQAEISALLQLLDADEFHITALSLINKNKRNDFIMYKNNLTIDWEEQPLIWRDSMERYRLLNFDDWVELNNRIEKIRTDIIETNSLLLQHIIKLINGQIPEKSHYKNLLNIIKKTGDNIISIFPMIPKCAADKYGILHHNENFASHDSMTLIYEASVINSVDISYERYSKTIKIFYLKLLDASEKYRTIISSDLNEKNNCLHHLKIALSSLDSFQIKYFKRLKELNLIFEHCKKEKEVLEELTFLWEHLTTTQKSDYNTNITSEFKTLKNNYNKYWDDLLSEGGEISKHALTYRYTKKHIIIEVQCEDILSILFKSINNFVYRDKHSYYKKYLFENYFDTMQVQIYDEFKKFLRVYELTPSDFLAGTNYDAFLRRIRVENMFEPQ